MLRLAELPPAWPTPENHRQEERGAVRRSNRSPQQHQTCLSLPKRYLVQTVPQTSCLGTRLQSQEGLEGLCVPSLSSTHQLLPRQLPLHSGWNRCYRQTSGTALPVRTTSQSAPARQRVEQQAWGTVMGTSTPARCRAPGTSLCNGQRGTDQRLAPANIALGKHRQ